MSQMVALHPMKATASQWNPTSKLRNCNLNMKMDYITYGMFCVL